MCVGKAKAAHLKIMAQQPVDDAVEGFMDLLSDLPVSERSGHALGVASRLIEYAAFEMAGTYSAEEVADLINCAARVDHVSSDVQTDVPDAVLPALRRMQ